MNQNDYEKIEKSAALRNKINSGVTYVFLTVWALIVLFPFYWMILSSVKSYSAYNSEYTPKFFTLSPTLQNYGEVFTAVPLANYLLNTLIFTVVTTAIMLFVTVLAAFAFVLPLKLLTSVLFPEFGTPITIALKISLIFFSLYF